ncbi:phage tail tape measure protein [Bacillus sp. FJAT-49705]|uniref:Phage tail tape measure protein n=1 Tax=Cytobacillus citreus TaxID=2833586 RepID=A0ABS5NME6_9BACI|nr:phage tail tape measure protein [Cytobacillus citreus]MBS4188654.1 phage tail tape measure protein [Cytobacillus citreus]
MTATVGSLQVDLTLTHAQFQRGIQDVNRQLKLVQSEFKLAGAGVQGFGNSLDGMRAKSRMLEQSLQQQQSKVEQLRQRYEQLKVTKGEDDAATQRMLISYNNAQAQMQRTEAELERLNQQIRLQSSAWHQWGQRMQAVGQTLKNVGQSMKNVGRQLSMKLTAPIVGLGTAAVKAGADFEEGMSRVSAISGATGKDFTDLRDLAKQLGADTKYSATEAASGMEFLAMAGFKTKDILSAMPGMLDLAAAGALDLGRAADIASNILSAFNIDAGKAGHVADVLAKAAASANTNVEQLGEGMKYLAPAANSLGWTLEDSTAAMMALGDAGIQGSLAGQAFASSLVRLANPTKRMGKVIKNTGMEFFDAAGNMKSMPEVIKELEIGLKGMTQEQKAAYLSMLFGAEAYKHWAVLLEKGSGALQENVDMLEKADGAAKEMAKTMSDNLKGELKTLLSALEGLAIKLSEILIPILRDVVEKLTEWTRAFAKLDEGTQKTILAVAGIAAAIGPALVVLGALVSSVGAIVSALGTVSAAIAVVTTGAAAATPAVGALAAVFTALTGPVGLAIAAIAGLTAGGIALYKNWEKIMELPGPLKTAIFALVPGLTAVVGGIKLVQDAASDAIPEIDRFGEGISKGTKKALEGFFELSDGAAVKVKEMTLGQKRMTEEMAASLVESYSKMNEQILAKMDERHTKQLESTRAYFINSNVLTDTEEEKILAKIDERNKAEQERQQYHGQRIKEIIETAAAEKRELTEREQQTINNIQQIMNENAVKYLSKNEVESKVILEKMKQQAGDITARQAAEVVKNSNKQRTDAVKEAEKEYKEKIAAIIRMRDESGVITAEQAEKMIAEAKKQRDETVKHAEDMHKNVVGEAKKQAGEHLEHVNWETGEVLSKWEVFKNKVGTTFDLTVGLTKKYWKMMTDEVTEKAENIKTNALTAFETLKNKAEEKFIQTKDKILTPIKEAKEKISGLVDDIKGFFENMKLKIPKIEMPKLPKFKLTGEFSLNPPSVPKIGVDWYAKGAVFTKPTVFNTPYGLKGFGEAGAEAALPLTDAVLGAIGEGIARTMQNNDIQSQKVFSPTTNNHFYSNRLTPSEVARKEQQASRQQAMEWGFQ